MSLVLLPPATDVLAAAASELLRELGASRPDLTRAWVLTPGPCAAPFRAALAKAAGTVLLGPQVTTLKEFARQRGAAAPPLSALACRLRLVEALTRHRPLYPGQDPWRIADALFTLFEDMTAAGCTLPAGEDEFTQRLAAAYRAKPIAALSLEARRIHLLWRAFQEDTRGSTPAGIHARALREALASLGDGERAFAVGYDRLAATEVAALAEALPRGRVRVFLRGRIGGRDGEATAGLCGQLGATRVAEVVAESPRSKALDAVFAAGEEPLTARAARFRGQPDLLASIRITEAAGAEHEARCVELAVRRAWLDGARNIAIVAPDRRVARRVRALLERAGLPLRDYGGWALSTSRAAASLAAWLDCVERDFDYRALLDLLKSGFLEAAAPQTVEDLEQHAVYRHGIESGLRRYLAHAHGDAAALIKLLAAAARRMPSTRAVIAPAEWAVALIASLQALKLWHGWQSDLAGRALVDELTALAAPAASPPRCSWADFRALLDRGLERATFIPEGGGPIRLLALEQTAALSADAVVMAGASREALPGAPPGDPFFNDAVRGDLGLPTWREHRALALSRFRQLLEAAPRVHLIYARAEATEPALPSPWVEALETFAACAGLPALRDTVLAEDAGTAGVEVAAASSRPAKVVRPAPKVPAALAPVRLSQSAHQALIDCPYRFFARHVLKLKAPEAPDDEADARDFGKRVHRILTAFHQRDEDLPPPFAGVVTPANLEQAKAKLAELAQALFAPDVERRIVTWAWHERFKKLVPTLAEWLAGRGRDWPTVSGELEMERDLGGVVVEGRVDRLERTASGGECVVDYKTGFTPPEEQVHSGEAVQLPHYALLCERPERVEYWSLKDKGKRIVLDGEPLAALTAGVKARLRESLRAIAAGAPLPAHGDEGVCKHCDYIGVCRKGTWS